MASPDSIFQSWKGMVDDDFRKTIEETFSLKHDDGYVYRVEAFAMTLAQVEAAIATGQYIYRYAVDGVMTKASESDITAYTSIFSSTTSTANTLKTFLANAKKGSPRAEIAHYLLSRRLFPSSPLPGTGNEKPIALSVPKLKPAKEHVNPYYDVWLWSCKETGFMGPLNLAEYANPAAARITHPVLPVLYHHFGCVCPSFEALSVISQLALKEGGVLEMAAGNGYWTYMLRRMGVKVAAVDNMEAVWRTSWIDDMVKANGVEYLKKAGGAKDQLLLMVYMVTKGEFTKQVLKQYRGDTIVVVGTQNANRFTGFADVTVEEYFEREKREFGLVVRIALPSFAGKDEGMFVYMRRK